MTWFLFGRFGTPALLAILGRETVRQEAPLMAPREQPVNTLHGPITALKAESAWFREEARRVFELISLPVLQLFAAALNFAVVTITSKPMFSLPFTSLDDVLAAASKNGSQKKNRPPKSTPMVQPVGEAVR